MLGFFTIPYQLNISPSLPFLSAISSPSFLSLPVYKFPLHYSFFRSQSQISSNRRRFTAFASNKNNELDGNIKEREGERNRANGSSNGGDDLRKERGPVFNIKWAELLIDPDPDNILAVALTGLLAWASVQVASEFEMLCLRKNLTWAVFRDKRLDSESYRGVKVAVFTSPFGLWRIIREGV